MYVKLTDWLQNISGGFPFSPGVVRWTLAISILVHCCPCHSEEGLRVDLYLDVTRLSIEGMMEQPGGFPVLTKRTPPRRLFLQAFVDGQTTFPTACSLFRQRRVGEEHNLFAKWAEWAGQGGFQTYAGFDCLRWTIAGAPPERDVFANNPGLLELNCGLQGGASDGKYASPFHPQVQAALVALVEDATVHCPEIEGLVLDCRLSLYDLLGYSENTRAAFIRNYSLDPIDIPLSFSDGDEEVKQALYTWVRWRLDEMTKLVGRLSQTFRERNTGGKVVARGFANLYRWAPSARLRTAQDWLNWAVEGHVDELILEGQWAAAENQNAYALALGLVQKAGVDVEVTPLLILYEEGGRRVGYEEQLQALQKQATLERVVLQVASPQDWEEAKAFLAKEHPVIETLLDTTSIAYFPHLGDFHFPRWPPPDQRKGGLRRKKPVGKHPGVPTSGCLPGKTLMNEGR
jgi:hypothetical protein